MKPYLITVSSNQYKDRYLEAVQPIEDSVERCSIFLDEYPGNLSRFKYFPIKELDPDRWWIFTDSADVSFQTPIPSLDDVKEDILVAPEGMTFRESWFFGQYLESFPDLLDILKDQPVYNMGSWAMRGDKALWLIAFLTSFAPKFYNDEQSDQPIFNLWLQIQKNIGVHPTLFTCLYKNLELGNVKKTDKGYVNKDGELYAIVHNNGLKV